MHLTILQLCSVGATALTTGSYIPSRMLVTVRLPVTVAVMHSGAKTHTGDNADYMHTVYLNTNNHHTSPRSVPHIGHTTTKHTGTESVWRVDFQMQYRGTTRLESREGPLNFGRIHVRPAQAKLV